MESSVRKYSERLLARDSPRSPRGGRNLEAGGPNPLPSLVLSLLRTQRQALGQAVRRPEARNPQRATDAATAPLFMGVTNAKPCFLARACAKCQIRRFLAPLMRLLDGGRMGRASDSSRLVLPSFLACLPF
jgi:hypothetical protein